jgi:hypothetical protein
MRVIRADLFNGLNNRKKVSVNLLTDEMVQEITIDALQDPSAIRMAAD